MHLDKKYVSFNNIREVSFRNLCFGNSIMGNANSGEQQTTSDARHVSAYLHKLYSIYHNRNHSNY